VTRKPVKKASKVKGPHCPRGAKEPSENEIHLKCFQWVQKAHPELLIFHVANERKAHVQYHVKMKRKGVLAGVADFLAFPVNGRKLAIELKDGKNAQDPDQIKFQRRWERAGGDYFIVRTLADFQITVDCAMMFG
jgi:hypothetical protein